MVQLSAADSIPSGNGREAEVLGLRRAVVIALAVLLLHGLLWWLDVHPEPRRLWGDEYTYLQSAAALLNGDPNWQPEPLWPPLYPRFVAGILAASGGRLTALWAAQSLLLALAAVLLYAVADRVAGSRLAAAAAAIAVLLYPPLAAFAHYLWPEVLHLTLMLAALWLLVARSDRLLWSGVAGVALGLALLTKSLLGPFLPVLLFAAYSRRPHRAAALRLAVLLLTLAATVTPTALEQRRRSGRLMLSDSSAFNLWVGLNDRGRRPFEYDVVGEAYDDWMSSAVDFSERNRILRRRIDDHLDSRSTLELLSGQLGRQYFLLFDRSSYLTDQLPGGPAVERWRVGYVAAPRFPADALRLASFAGYAGLLAAAPFGLLLWRFRDRRWFRVLLLFIAYNLLIFFWLHVKTRYRIQMLPVAFLGWGCAVEWLRARTTLPKPAPWRLLAAAALSAAGLFFAFAGRLL